MTTWITICEGCKRPGRADDAPPRAEGGRLAEAIETRASGSSLATRRVSCTMGCARACNVVIQGEGKIGYSLGMFDGSEEDAQAILDFATAHAASETGQVPFRQWPQGVKGHFVSRHLPVPAL